MGQVVALARRLHAMLVLVHADERLESLLQYRLLVGGFQLVLDVCDHVVFDTWVAT